MTCTWWFWPLSSFRHSYWFCNLDLASRSKGTLKILWKAFLLLLLLFLVFTVGWFSILLLLKKKCYCSFRSDKVSCSLYSSVCPACCLRVCYLISEEALARTKLREDGREGAYLTYCYISCHHQNYFYIKTGKAVQLWKTRSLNVSCPGTTTFGREDEPGRIQARGVTPKLVSPHPPPHPRVFCKIFFVSNELKAEAPSSPLPPFCSPLPAQPAPLPYPLFLPRASWS